MTDRSTTRWLLLAGVIGPILFVIVFLVEGWTRAGYDPMRMFVSLLALSDDGWQQIVNFVVSGVLVAGGAVGLRSVLREGPGSTWGPRLIGLAGVGMVLAGVFVTDPGFGYPPVRPPRTLPPMSARLPVLEVVLVRHAEAVPVGTPPWDVLDDERPLTEVGLRDADELALELDPYHFNAAYSSPYARSLQTVTPAAARHALEVQLLEDLCERRLTVASQDDWPDLLARAWADPDYAAPGGETGRAAQLRGMRVLDLLRARHAAGGRVLVGSHGNLISLILQALEPEVGHAFHLAMPNPAVFHLEHDGIGWRVLGGHGFAAIDGLQSAERA